MRLLEGTPWDRPPRCDRCGALEADCQCPAESPARIPPEKQTARLAVERRQKGKMVIVIRGLPPEGNDLDALLSHLKSACGAGGTVRENGIEIQGSQVERVRQTLQAMGYKVKG